MLQRLYVHNYRCLENFEFKPGDTSSALLIGKNGTGKSTLRQVLKLFQAVGRGTNRVGQLARPEDFTLGRTDVPMRFELEATLGRHAFHYTLVLELPERTKDMRVLEEVLSLDGQTVLSRNQSEVNLIQRSSGAQVQLRFDIDWHLVALPVIAAPSPSGELHAFREWLAGMVMLAPVPSVMTGEAATGSLAPLEDGSNVADWLAGLLARYPAAYATLSQHLRQVMPDLADFRFEEMGRNARSLLVRFKANTAQHELPFDALSDGEKCFFLCAVVLAANECYGPLFAFWDEPDNFLSIAEVGHFVMALRRGFRQGGQIVMTSHNDEAVRRFSNDNTWVLGRKSHLEPTVIRLLEELPPTPDVVQSLILGELEP